MLSAGNGTKLGNFSFCILGGKLKVIQQCVELINKLRPLLQNQQSLNSDITKKSQFETPSSIDLAHHESGLLMSNLERLSHVIIMHSWINTSVYF